MHKPFSQPVIGMALIGLLVAGSAAAYAWNRTAHQAGPQVFYDAVESALTTPGVTCEINKQGNGSSSSQRIVLDLQSRANARSVTTLTENSTKVVTEGIATSSDDYVRYTAIEAPRSEDGSRRDFSQVLRIWSKQPRGESGGVSLFEQAVLGGCVVPLADFPTDTATGLMADITQGRAMQADFTKVGRGSLNGTAVYEYPVTLTGAVYIKFMKKVASSYGLKSLDQVDEEAYAQRAPEKLTFKINRSSHRLEQIVYSGQEQTVTFSDYGARPAISVPKNTISTLELQKRLEAVR